MNLKNEQKIIFNYVYLKDSKNLQIQNNFYCDKINIKLLILINSKELKTLILNSNKNFNIISQNEIEKICKEEICSINLIYENLNNENIFFKTKIKNFYSKNFLLVPENKLFSEILEKDSINYYYKKIGFKESGEILFKNNKNCEIEAKIIRNIFTFDEREFDNFLNNKNTINLNYLKNKQKISYSNTMTNDCYYGCSLMFSVKNKNENKNFIEFDFIIKTNVNDDNLKIIKKLPYNNDYFFGAFSEFQFSTEIEYFKYEIKNDNIKLFLEIECEFCVVLVNDLDFQFDLNENNKNLKYQIINKNNIKIKRLFKNISKLKNKTIYLKFINYKIERENKNNGFYTLRIFSKKNNFTEIKPEKNSLCEIKTKNDVCNFYIKKNDLMTLNNEKNIFIYVNNENFNCDKIKLNVTKENSKNFIFENKNSDKFSIEENDKYFLIAIQNENIGKYFIYNSMVEFNKNNNEIFINPFAKQIFFINDEIQLFSKINNIFDLNLIVVKGIADVNLNNEKINDTNIIIESNENGNNENQLVINSKNELIFGIFKYFDVLAFNESDFENEIVSFEEKEESENDENENKEDNKEEENEKEEEKEDIDVNENENKIKIEEKEGEVEEKIENEEYNKEGEKEGEKEEQKEEEKEEQKEEKEEEKKEQKEEEKEEKEEEKKEEKKEEKEEEKEEEKKEEKEEEKEEKKEAEKEEEEEEKEDYSKNNKMVFDFTESIQIINKIDSTEEDYISYIEINSDIEELEDLDIKGCISSKKDLSNFSSNNNDLIQGTYNSQNQIGKILISKNKITEFVSKTNDKKNIYLIINISSKLYNNKKIKGTFILNKFENFYEPKIYYDGNLSKNEPEKNYNLYLNENDNFLLLEITNLNNIEISFYNFNDKNNEIEIISEENIFNKKYFIIQTKLKKIKLNIKLKNENNLIENYLFKYETSEKNNFKILKNLNKIEKKINLQFNNNKNIKFLFNSFDNNEFINTFSFLYIYAYNKDENKPEKLNDYLIKYKINNDENDFNVQINLDYDNKLNYVAIINSKVQDNSNKINYLFENEAEEIYEENNFEKYFEKYRLFIIIGISVLLFFIILCCCCCKNKKNKNGFAKLGEENTFENNKNKYKSSNNNNKLELTGSSNSNSNSNSFN